jgi:hypothetical protein
MIGPSSQTHMFPGFPPFVHLRKTVRASASMNHMPAGSFREVESLDPFTCSAPGPARISPRLASRSARDASQTHWNSVGKMKSPAVAGALRYRLRIIAPHRAGCNKRDVQFRLSGGTSPDISVHCRQKRRRISKWASGNEAATFNFIARCGKGNLARSRLARPLLWPGRESSHPAIASEALRICSAEPSSQTPPAERVA